MTEHKQKPVVICVTVHFMNGESHRIKVPSGTPGGKIHQIVETDTNLVGYLIPTSDETSPLDEDSLRLFVSTRLTEDTTLWMDVRNWKPVPTKDVLHRLVNACEKNEISSKEEDMYGPLSLLRLGPGITDLDLSLIHISEPTRPERLEDSVLCV